MLRNQGCEDSSLLRVVDFQLEERRATYTLADKMDSTNEKMFSVVDEPFEKK